MTVADRSDQQSEQYEQYAEQADVTAALKADHEVVEALFIQYEEESSDPAHQQDLAWKIFDALDAHAQVEEQLVYPLAEAQMDSQGKPTLEEFRQAHLRVKELTRTLKSLSSEGTRYARTFQELIDNVRDHRQKEESLLFPALDKLPGEQRQHLAARLQQRK